MGVGGGGGVEIICNWRSGCNILSILLMGRGLQEFDSLYTRCEQLVIHVFIFKGGGGGGGANIVNSLHSRCGY